MKKVRFLMRSTGTFVATMHNDDLNNLLLNLQTRKNFLVRGRNSEGNSFLINTDAVEAVYTINYEDER